VSKCARKIPSRISSYFPTAVIVTQRFLGETAVCPLTTAATAGAAPGQAYLPYVFFSSVHQSISLLPHGQGQGQGKGGEHKERDALCETHQTSSGPDFTAPSHTYAGGNAWQVMSDNGT
jgi:hypothetical protein